MVDKVVELDCRHDVHRRITDHFSGEEVVGDDGGVGG